MVQLQAQNREIFGKKVSSLLEQGLIPAEAYGHGIENKHICVERKSFASVLKEAGESTIIELVIDGKKHPALIHQVSTDILGDTTVHVDFYLVKMDEKIRTSVQLNFVGEAPAVKEKSGVLIKAMDEIEVEALPADLPHQIDVDLSALADLNQSIHVKDLKVSDKVRVLADEDTTVATVTEQRVEEEPVVVATPTEGEGAAPTSEGGDKEKGAPAPESKK